MVLDEAKQDQIIEIERPAEEGEQEQLHRERLGHGSHYELTEELQRPAGPRDIFFRGEPPKRKIRAARQGVWKPPHPAGAATPGRSTVENDIGMVLQFNLETLLGSNAWSGSAAELRPSPRSGGEKCHPGRTYNDCTGLPKKELADF
jgi:hypothetical protein